MIVKKYLNFLGLWNKREKIYKALKLTYNKRILKLIKVKDNDINIDVNDLDAVCSHEGFAYVKSIKCNQMDECIEKIKNFSFNPKGVIVKFKIRDDLPLSEIEKFMDFIYEISDKEADIIFGSETTENKKIEINLIFTGIKKTFKWWRQRDSNP
jgi:cell division protein FtsZ